MTDFDFVDSPGFEWVDSPGAEWLDSTTDDPTIIKLTRPGLRNISTLYRCHNISTLYRCRLAGGERVYEIFLGYSNVIDVEMYATNANTGEEVVLTPDQMAEIERVRLVLGNTIIDSNITLHGDGLPFDWTTKAANGTLRLTMGGQAFSPGLYHNTHVAVDFTNTTKPLFMDFEEEVKVYPNKLL